MNMQAPMSGSLKKQAYALAQRGQVSKAKEIYAGLCHQHPEDPELWYLLGAVNEQLGRAEDALANYQKAVAIKPNYAEAQNDLGTLYERRNETDLAFACYEQAVRAKPSFAPARYNLGVQLKRRGQLAQAVDCLRAGTQSWPQSAEMWFELGAALKLLERFPEAIAALRQAVRIKPDSPAVHNVLGNALHLQGDLGSARQCYQRAVELDPSFAEGWNNLGSALWSQGNIHEALTHYRHAVSLNPSWSGAHSNLLLSMNYVSTDGNELLRAHREWANTHGNVSGPALTSNPEPERKLRIGYLSPDFRGHSVAYFVLPLLRSHDRTAFDVFCYADVAHADWMTRQCQGLVGQGWRGIYGFSDDAVTARILEDRIDILVDLTGHTSNNRLVLFARKPAPVQVAYLGYPNTTGLQTMDYRITDALADPEGASDAYYTEKLVRLPDGFMCYAAPDDSLPAAPPPSAANGAITFGSFNPLAKTTPEVVAAWSAILTAVPDARLILKSPAFGEPETRRRYHALFAAHGIEPPRLDFLVRSPTLGEHLSAYGRMDIALDTFPYNGATTTCEALWMGVPVITYAGTLHAGRVGLSLLSQVGLGELVAYDVESYVRKAVSLSQDREHLATWRSTLRTTMLRSPLCDASGFTRELEQAYRHMWRTWCQRA
jgi:predicted O-linked N-acetylglucosamine transferase (SPINDLY family)